MNIGDICTRESVERKPLASAAPLPPLRVPLHSYS